MMEKLNAILAGEGLRPIATGALQTRSENITDQTGLRASLAAFGAGEGWLCLTDEVIEIGPGENLDRLAGRIILSGEIAADDKSLHLRQQGAGWLVVQLQRVSAKDSYLVEQTFLATRGERRLRYEVCWCADADGVLAPAVSRFAGFVTGGNDHD